MPNELLSVARLVATWSLGAVSRAAEPLTSAGRPRWLVNCSCGWGRECVPEWAAQLVNELHQQLGEVGVEHVTKIEEPKDREQLPLT